MCERDLPTNWYKQAWIDHGDLAGLQSLVLEAVVHSRTGADQAAKGVYRLLVALWRETHAKSPFAAIRTLGRERVERLARSVGLGFYVRLSKSWWDAANSSLDFTTVDHLSVRGRNGGIHGFGRKVATYFVGVRDGEVNAAIIDCHDMKMLALFGLIPHLKNRSKPTLQELESGVLAFAGLHERLQQVCRIEQFQLHVVLWKAARGELDRIILSEDDLRRALSVRSWQPLWRQQDMYIGDSIIRH